MQILALEHHWVSWIEIEIHIVMKFVLRAGDQLLSPFLNLRISDALAV